MSEPSRADRRGTRFAVLGLVVLLAAAYAALVLMADDRVPSGTQVAGVALGGMSRAEAADRLSADLVPRADDPIEVRIGDETREVDPAELGLDVDVEATVARAHGGSRVDPRVLWDALAGGGDVPPVLSVDQDQLVDGIRALAERTDQPATEPRVSFTAQRPVPHRPAVGHRLDTPGAVVAILDGWLVQDDPIALPSETVRPEIGQAELTKAVENVAGPVFDGPVRLQVAGRPWVLPPRRFAPALELSAEDGALVPVLDEALLARRLPQVLSSGSEPRNATVRLDDGRPVVVPARTGVEIQAADLADGLLAALDGGQREARVRGKSQAPDVTTREARGWGIEEPVSSFTTEYPHEDYRNTNIGRAAELINGTVLAPGELFSLNETVGERTRANGFTVGYVISDGVFAEDLGGGVSQAATTTFNAAFFAGLQDVEHKPHSFYIDRYPMGREATVAWPTVDLRFRNTTPHGVLIQAFIDPSEPGGSGAMTVRMWSTKYWTIEARSSGPYAYTSPGTQTSTDPDCVPQTGYQGFDIDVYRDFYRRGDKVRTETMHTTYIPADTVICR